MRLYHLFLSVFIIVSTFCVGVESSPDSKELLMLDRLIEATQQSLDSQKSLRLLIKQYQELQTLYLQDTDNNELLLKVAKIAYNISESIKINHLDHSFDPEFLSELSLFAKVASKRGIPPPVLK